MDDLNKIATTLRRMKPRVIFQQMISFGLVVSTALMIWKGLMVVTGSPSPIVVVLSGSMEPAFQRGDLLLLTQSDGPFNIGDIVVFNTDGGASIPIVHRILETHERKDGKVDFLTKGDANPIHDRGLYRGLVWLNRHHVMGRAQAYLPHIGMITILMNDWPAFKFFMIFMLAAFVVVNRE